MINKIDITVMFVGLISISCGGSDSDSLYGSSFFQNGPPQDQNIEPPIPSDNDSGPVAQNTGGSPSVAQNTGGFPQVINNTGGASNIQNTGGTTVNPIPMQNTGGVIMNPTPPEQDSGVHPGIACKPSSCPICNISIGPACCTPAGNCGCPSFWIPGSCS